MPPGTQATLFARLVNNDADTTTSVTLDGIVEVLTAPGSAPTNAGTTIQPAPVIGPDTLIDLNQLVDVTDQVQIDYATTTFDESDDTVRAGFSLTNISGSALRGPLLVAVRGLTDPGVAVIGVDGQSPDGDPYLDLTRFVFDAQTGQLDPGTTIDGLELAFINPDRVQFDYELVVLASPNRGPGFVGTPDGQVTRGQVFSTIAEADDPDGDTVTYSLLAGPAGMSIDPVTGVLAWDTTGVTDDNVSVIVSAADPFGGSTQQAFDVAVVDTVPNRPPVFVSSPQVQASFGTTYTYTATAQDPDGDTVTYSLLSGPAGLAIDANSGVVTWNPLVGDVGQTFTVQIQADDGNGGGGSGGTSGGAVQGYDLLVTQADDNHAPLITSDPATSHGLASDNSSSTGQVSPDVIELILADGATAVEQVLFTAESSGVQGSADIVIVVDESGSMGAGQAWIGPMVEDLNAQLEAQGITANRFGLVGFAGSPHTFPLGQPFRVRVFDPTGDLVGAMETGGENTIGDIDLPVDGLYSVLIDQPDGLTGPLDIDLSLDATTPLPVTIPSGAAPLTIGDTTTTAMTGDGSQQHFTFTLTESRWFLLDTLSDRTDVEWTLAGPYVPLDIPVSEPRQLTQDRLKLPLVLGPGDYVLTLTALSADTSDLSFRLLDLANATPQTLDTPTTVSISNDTHLFRFDAVAGDEIAMEAIAASGASGTWQLIDPLGQKIFGDLLVNSGLLQKLEHSGTYTVSVEGSSWDDTVNDLTFSVLSLNETVSPLTIGTPVNASLTSQVDRHVYTFTLTEAKRLAFDSFTSSHDLRWTLRGGEGDIRSNKSFASDTGEPIIRLEPGDYEVEVMSSGGANVSYGFALLDLATAAPLTIGTAQTVTLTNETAMFQFDAVAGDALAFDAQIFSGVSATWQLVDPFGLEVFTRSAKTDEPLGSLPHDGTYTLLIKSVVSDTSADDYTFAVLPVNETATGLTLGATVNASLTGPTARHTYTFALGESKRVSFDALSVNASLRWTLDGPLGAVKSNQNFGSDVASPLSLEAGSYTLTLSSSTGVDETYSFRLLDLAAATSITRDTPVTVSMTNQTQMYQYDAVAGDRVAFDSIQSLAVNATWRLFDPRGGQVFSGSVFDQPLMTLDHDGTYTLLVYGQVWDTTANDLEFSVLSPNVTTTPLTLSDTVDTALAGPADRHVYTFTLTDRSVLVFDSLINSSTPRWGLAGPLGDVRSNRPFSADATEQALRLEAGDYELTVHSFNGAADPYTFRLLDLDGASPLTVGSPVTVSMANESTLYHFDAQNGEAFNFDSQIATGVSANWALFDPVGKGLLERTITTDDTGRILTRSGTYTLLIEGNPADITPNDLTFQVTLDPAPTVTIPSGALPLVFGQAESGTIATAGEQVDYTFTLADHALLWFDSLISSGALDWSLVGPAGSVVNTQSIWADSSAPISVGPGDYVLTVFDTGTATGNFDFRLLDLASATPVTLDVSETVSMSNDTHLFRFDAVAGDAIALDVITTTSVTGDWRLIGPTGDTELFTRSFPSDHALTTLDHTGTHTIVVQGSRFDSTVNDLTFAALAVNEPTTALTLGDTINTSLTSPADRHVYTFNLATSKRLVFDSFTNSSTVRWDLTGPVGAVITNQQIRLDVGESLLDLPAGDYELSVISNTGASSPYSFRLLDIEAATPLVVGDTTTVSMTNLTQMVRFDLAVGDEVAFDSITSAGVAGNWRLFNPVGAQVFNRSLSSDDQLRTYARSGTYTLLLEGAVTDTAAHDFTFAARPINETVTPLNLGETINTSLTSPVDRHLYTFTLAQAKRLVFDGLTHNASLRWSLDGPTGSVRSDELLTTDAGGDLLELMAGDYELSIQSSVAASDAYSFRLLDLAAAPLLPLGTPITVSMTNQTLMYRIDAAAGDEFYFDSIQSTLVNGSWRLIDPAGAIASTISWQLNQDFPLRPRTLTGPYTLLIEGNASDTTAHDLIFSAGPANESTATITPGQTIQDSLDSPGDRDIYEFTAVAGQSVFIDWIHGDSNQIDAALVDPDGNILIDLQNDTAQADEAPAPIVVGGTYRVVVDSDFSGTGQYSFRLIDTAVAGIVDRGSSFTTTLTEAARVEAFSFTGSAGDHVSLSLPDSFLMGSAQEISALTAGLVTTRSGFEDGYEAIFHAYSNFPFRENASPNIILVTDEDRDDSESHVWNSTLNLVDPDGLFKRLNRSEVVSIIDGSGIALTSVVAALLGDDAGSPQVLGVNADGAAYLPDGSGGVVTSSGGVFLAPSNGAVDPPPNTVEEDYVTLTWEVGGSVWDFEFLRDGGINVDSFTAGFVDQVGQTIEESFALDVIASDPNVVITNLTGPLFGVSPDQTVSFDIEFTGDMQPQSFDLLIVRADDPGIVLGSIPVRLNAGYIYDVVAADLDQDTLSYEIIGDDHGAVIDAATGRLLWNPTASGSFDFTVRVTDGHGGSAEQSWTVEVKDANASNADPVITSAALEEAAMGQAYQYPVTASDADGDTLRYQLFGSTPDGITIDPVNGLITWTPDSTQAGSFSVDVQVIDSRGGLDTQTLNLTVAPEPVPNRDPQIVSTPVTQVTAGDTYRYSFAAFDVDADPITFDLSLAPEGMTIDGTTRTVVWEPTLEHVGDQQVVIRAQDGRGGVDTQRFTIEVTAPNRHPQFLSTPTPEEGTTSLTSGVFTYQAQTIDPDGDTVMYSLPTAPTGASIDPNTGLLTWTPTVIEDVDFVVQADDGRGGITQQSFTVSVINNAPPVFDAQQPLEPAIVGQPWSFTPDVTDPEGAAITLSVDAAAAALGITVTGETLTWTPDATHLGTTTIDLTATDTGGAFSTITITLPVNSLFDPNEAPVITSVPTAPGLAIIGQLFEYQAQAIDPDGDPLMWLLEDGPDGASIDAATGLFTWTPTAADLAVPADIAIRVVDPLGNGSTQSFTLTVGQLNTPPLITSTPVTVGGDQRTVSLRRHRRRSRGSSGDDHRRGGRSRQQHHCAAGRPRRRADLHPRPDRDVPHHGHGYG